MIESSVQRTPVEIWCQILAFAIRSPLLPGGNDGILEAMAVLSSGCEADRVARNAQHRVETVRLVCRSWNAVVKDIRSSVLVATFTSPPERIAPHVVILPSAGVLTQARRLEVWDQLDCACSDHLCRYSVIAEAMRKPRKILDRFENSADHFCVDALAGVEPPSSSMSNLKELEVFVTRWETPGLTNRDLLNRMPSLKALSWGFPPSDPRFSDLIRHPVRRRLTHLEMKFSWDLIAGLAVPVDFPQLRHLRLLFSETTSSGSSSGDRNLANWARFPVLSSLILAGEMDHCRHDEVYMLLGNCGSTLSSFLVDIKWNLNPGRTYTFEITPRLWDFLPVLVKFGPGVEALVRNPPPPALARPPIGVLLSTIPPNAFMDPFPVEPKDCLTSFLLACGEWQTKEVVLLESWKQATLRAKATADTRTMFKLMETYHMPRDPKLYELLAEQGIDVFDSNWVPITDKDGAEFLKTLQYGKSTFKETTRAKKPEGWWPRTSFRYSWGIL